MRLTSAQVTQLRQAVDKYYSGVASRGAVLHIAMEELAETFIEIVTPPVPTTVARKE